MRRIDRVRWGMAFVLLMLLGMPAAGWARTFYYTRPHYYFLPVQMQFTDMKGNPIGRSSNMIMYGGQTREFAVDVVDFNRNGVIDIHDFKVWSITPAPISLDILISGDPEVLSEDLTPDVSLDIFPVPPNLPTDRLLQMAPQLLESFEAAFLSMLSRNYTHFHLRTHTQDLLDCSLDGFNSGYYNSAINPNLNPSLILPRRVALFRVTPRQQLGDKSSDYNEQLAHFKYTLYWGQRAALDDDDERKKLTTLSETPEMNVIIRATDQGGKGGDNGGGSCDALALGAVSLLIPGLFLRRRTK